jgi:hypothetical protein
VPATPFCVSECTPTSRPDTVGICLAMYSIIWLTDSCYRWHSMPAYWLCFFHGALEDNPLCQAVAICDSHNHQICWIVVFPSVIGGLLASGEFNSVHLHMRLNNSIVFKFPSVVSLRLWSFFRATPAGILEDSVNMLQFSVCYRSVKHTVDWEQFPMQKNRFWGYYPFALR